MKKKSRKLSLNRETVRILEGGLEGAAGGFSKYCTESVTDCGSGCPNCDSTRCGGGSGGFCTAGVCSADCETGGACTL